MERAEKIRSWIIQSMCLLLLLEGGILRLLVGEAPLRTVMVQVEVPILCLAVWQLCRLLNVRPAYEKSLWAAGIMAVLAAVPFFADLFSREDLSVQWVSLMLIAIIFFNSWRWHPERGNVQLLWMFIPVLLLCRFADSLLVHICMIITGCALSWIGVWKRRASTMPLFDGVLTGIVLMAIPLILWLTDAFTMILHPEQLQTLWGDCLAFARDLLQHPELQLNPSLLVNLVTRDSFLLTLVQAHYGWPMFLLSVLPGIVLIVVGFYQIKRRMSTNLYLSVIIYVFLSGNFLLYVLQNLSFCVAVVESPMLLGGTIFTNILVLFFGKFLGNGIQLYEDEINILDPDSEFLSSRMF